LAGNETVTAYEDITHYNNFYEFGSALLFNGYPEVASLYSTMDLRTFF
jgi:hypothetical protein